MIKVLVVDDSALVRKLFGRALSDASDFEVAFARDGLEALEQLGTFKPDVVTLDIHMPQMDGLACLNRIMIERPCPVVMVSSMTAEGADTTLEALRLGAVDFVAKPGGAVSLHMEEFAPHFAATIRSAAQVKIKSSSRLRERIQHRLGGIPAPAKQRRTASAARFGIVLVGSSTGGPPALEKLLTPLPATFPWPIVIAQHMPASFTGALARRLNNICAIGVQEITQTTALDPGCAYIAMGDADVVVSLQRQRPVAAPAPALDYPWHPSADRLVRSAMEHIPAPQLVGILLTGMGNDGAAAMTSLRALGGQTIAESEETAVVWGMPGELVRNGGAEWVLPVQKIAEKLQRVVPHHAADPKRV